MSAGYGYYHIDIVNKDCSKNISKAKETFDYCMKTYSWFSQDNAFCLEENEISTNYEELPDGFDAKHGVIPIQNDFDWLCDVQKQVNIERIVVSLHVDFTESYIEDGETEEVAVIEDGKIIKKESHSLTYADRYYEYDGDSWYYLISDNITNVRAKFENKKTKEELLGGYVVAIPHEDYEDDGLNALYEGEYSLVLTTDEDNITLLDIDGDEAKSIYNYHHFLDDINPVDMFYETRENDEWQFVGFEGQRSLKDTYATYPPIEQLKEI